MKDDVKGRVLRRAVSKKRVARDAAIVLASVVAADMVERAPLSPERPSGFKLDEHKTASASQPHLPAPSVIHPRIAGVAR